MEKSICTTLYENQNHIYEISKISTIIFGKNILKGIKDIYSGGLENKR